MKTPGSDLRVSGITFLVRGDQTPPLLGSDTFCPKMESRFELRGRCQLSLWTTTLTKNSQHLAAARSALGSLGTDSDLAYGFWSACDTSRSSVSTSCRVQKANETCCIPCMYKYKEDPPKQIWVDFGCGCNEMALNYLAEHYGDTEFFVDAFHNYSHKCPSCFESKRFPEYGEINTSLMEQINSFLQPLRGILKSGTTKVR